MAQMYPNSPPTAQRSSPPHAPHVPRSPLARSRFTNSPHRATIDGRTALGRRVRDLAESFASALGGWQALTAVTAVAVMRAAELAALAEATRNKALRLGEADGNGIVRLERMADRAQRALGLPSPSATDPPSRRARVKPRAQVPDLADLVRGTR